MKQSHTLSALERSITGKGGARKTRSAGLCPAVLYGPGTPPKTIQVDPRQLQKLLHEGGESALIDLAMDGGEGNDPEIVKVIIREVNYPPIGDHPLHVDFYRVSLDRKISISVPVVLTGVCEAVEIKAGHLNQLVHELGIECLPTDIPEKIEVDISSLTLGQSLHVSDIAVNAKFDIAESSDLPVVSLSAVKEEEEEKEEAAPEAEAAEPELVKGEKDEGASED